jgi:hypothetical protein
MHTVGPNSPLFLVVLQKALGTAVLRFSWSSRPHSFDNMRTAVHNYTIYFLSSLPLRGVL